MAIKYVDNKNVTPQGGSRHHGTERPKYPSTCEFASEKEEFDSYLEHCKTSRRPGGSYRKGHGFSTIGSNPSQHPDKAGTEEAKKHIIHCNIQE